MWMRALCQELPKEELHLGSTLRQSQGARYCEFQCVVCGHIVDGLPNRSRQARLDREVQHSVKALYKGCGFVQGDAFHKEGLVEQEPGGIFGYGVADAG